MDGNDKLPAAGELAVSREERQRTRNRLAQRRHRERKRFADSRAYGERRNSISHAPVAEHHDMSNPHLPTPPHHHSLPTTTGAHFGLMPFPSPWDGGPEIHIPAVHGQDLTDLSPLQQQAEGASPALAQRFPVELMARHAGARKGQPVGAEFMHLIEGDFWPQAYRAHELWDPINGKPMAAIPDPAAAVQLVSPHTSSATHRARTDGSGSRSRSNSDGESSASSDASERPPSARYTTLSLPWDHHDTGEPQRRRARAHRHGDAAPPRPTPGRAWSTPTLTPAGAEPRGRRRPADADADADATGLEARLERVLHVVEDSGFDSIDSMTAAYYTSALREASFLRPMQAASRTRRLRSLLAALQAAHGAWAERERRAYAEEVVRAAEGLCSDELGGLYHGARTPSSSPPSASLREKRSEVARRAREVLSSPDISEFLQKDQAALQNAVPETWSMMIELARKAGLQPHERVMVACVSIYLLTDHRST